MDDDISLNKEILEQIKLQVVDIVKKINDAAQIYNPENNIVGSKYSGNTNERIPTFCNAMDYDLNLLMSYYTTLIDYIDLTWVTMESTDAKIKEKFLVNEEG